MNEIQVSTKETHKMVEILYELNNYGIEFIVTIEDGNFVIRFP
jgi:hypothetical protein